MNRQGRLIIVVFLSLIVLSVSGSNINLIHPNIVYANGYIDFEDGTDGESIQSTIPGLEFITTQGYDWIYGDWRTGNYNGKYPDGPYTSNGNFFAGLGPNQGDGVINFTQSDATYLSGGVSTPLEFT